MSKVLRLASKVQRGREKASALEVIDDTAILIRNNSKTGFADALASAAITERKTIKLNGRIPGSVDVPTDETPKTNG